MSDIETVREFLVYEGHIRHKGRCYSYCKGCKRRDAFDRLEAELAKMREARDEAITESRRLCKRLDAAEEVLERVKGLVPEWRERGRNKPEFAGGYYFILADELEAALADQQDDDV